MFQQVVLENSSRGWKTRCRDNNFFHPRPIWKKKLMHLELELHLFFGIAVPLWALQPLLAAETSASLWPFFFLRPEWRWQKSSVVTSGPVGMCQKLQNWVITWESCCIEIRFVSLEATRNGVKWERLCGTVKASSVQSNPSRYYFFDSLHGLRSSRGVSHIVKSMDSLCSLLEPIVKPSSSTGVTSALQPKPHKARLSYNDPGPVRTCKALKKCAVSEVTWWQVFVQWLTSPLPENVYFCCLFPVVQNLQDKW